MGKVNILKSKRSQSEIIGYVLLIIVAITMSIIVYKSLKTYVPKEAETCPEDVAVSFRDYACDSINEKLYLDLENKGLFNVSSFRLRGSNSSGDVATKPLGNGEGGAGYFTFSQDLAPGKDEEKIIDYKSNNLPNIKFIELVPSRIESGKTKFCSNSIIRQDLTCDWDSTMVMHLAFEGSLQDLTPYHNNGYCDANKNPPVCPILTNGIIGSSAYNFSGNQYITVPVTSDNIPGSLNFGTKDFSISLWAKIPSTSTGYILDKVGLTNGYDIYGKTFELKNNNLVIGTCSPSEWRDGNWHNLVFVVDRQYSKITGYIDGLQQCTASITSFAASVSSNNDLTIGAQSGTHASGITGSIDDVRIYNKILKISEISSIYASAPTRCVDSDVTPQFPDGKNPLVFGTVIVTGLPPFSDSCVSNSNAVNEQYCDPSGPPGVVQISCPSGTTCSNGACLCPIGNSYINGVCVET